MGREGRREREERRKERREGEEEEGGEEICDHELHQDRHQKPLLLRS